MAIALLPALVGAPALFIDTRTAWLVCRTRPHCESKFAALLTAEKIHYFLPLVNRVRRQRDQTRQVLTPLFAGIVFACVPPQMKTRIHQQDLLLSTETIADERRFLRQLAAIKLIIAAGVETEAVPLPINGRRARITSGALEGLEGEIGTSANSQGIVVSMDVLQQGLRVRVPLENFQLLS